MICVCLALTANRVARIRPQRAAVEELQKHGYAPVHAQLPGWSTLINLVGLRTEERCRESFMDVIAVTGFGDGDLSPVRRLPYVQRFSCLGRNTTDDSLRHLSGCTEATYIDLDLTPVTDQGLPHLVTVPNLKELCLSRTQITDEGLKAVAKMSSLQSLDLRETAITDAGLAELGPLRLESLLLDKTAVTDVGLENLSHMPLLYIQLFDTKVTEQGLAKLQKALPVCRIQAVAGGKLWPSPRIEPSMQ
jgi:hypothetical protein